MASLSAPKQFSQITNSNQTSEKEEILKKLMSKLRSRASRQKNWADTSKLLNISLKDKKLLSSREERTILRDHLQKLVRIARATNSPIRVKERLESIAMELGLRYSDKQYPTHHIAVIATDHFHVEFRLDTTGRTMDATVTHGSNSSTPNQPTSCSEISQALNECKLETVKEHIKGLMSMYTIGSDQNRCKKAYISLQAMENDLNEMAQLCSTPDIKTVADTIHKAPLGILYPRSGGCPLKMLYFVAPYDLLNEKTKTSLMITDVTGLNDSSRGQYLTVSIENSNPRKLQHQSLIKKSSNNSEYEISALDNHNSSVLPAVFYLNLQKPMIITRSILEKIEIITDINISNENDTFGCLVSMLISDVNKSKFGKRCGIEINLPNQKHAYFFNENTSERLKAIYVKKIPFIHPTHVPAIIAHLRAQALFNSILSSCTGFGKIVKDEETLHNYKVFETTIVSLKHISVSFENPSIPEMSTVEYKLNNATSVECVLRSFTDSNKNEKEKNMSKIFLRSQSIPVTMREIYIESKDKKSISETISNVEDIPVIASKTSPANVLNNNLEDMKSTPKSDIQITCPPPQTTSLLTPSPLPMSSPSISMISQSNVVRSSPIVFPTINSTNMANSQIFIPKANDPLRGLARSAQFENIANPFQSILHRTVSDPGHGDSELAKCKLLTKLLDNNVSSPDSTENETVTVNTMAKPHKKINRKRKAEQIRSGRSPKRKISGDEFDFEMSSMITPTVGSISVEEDRPSSVRSLPEDNNRPSFLNQSPSRPTSASDSMNIQHNLSNAREAQQTPLLAEILNRTSPFTNITDLATTANRTPTHNSALNNHNFPQFLNYQHPKQNITVKLKLGNNNGRDSPVGIFDDSSNHSTNSVFKNESNIMPLPSEINNDVGKKINARKKSKSNDLKRKRSDNGEKKFLKKSITNDEIHLNNELSSFNKSIHEQEPLKLTIGGKVQIKKPSNKNLAKAVKNEKNKVASKNKLLQRSKSEIEVRRPPSLKVQAKSNATTSSPSSISSFNSTSIINNSIPSPQATQNSVRSAPILTPFVGNPPLPVSKPSTKNPQRKKSLSEVISKLHPTTSNVEPKLSSKDEMEKIRRQMIQAGNSNLKTPAAKLGPIPKKASMTTANKITPITTNPIYNNINVNNMKTKTINKLQQKSPASPVTSLPVSIKELTQDELVDVDLPAPKTIPLDRVGTTMNCTIGSPNGASSDADSPGTSLIIDTSQNIIEPCQQQQQPQISPSLTHS